MRGIRTFVFQASYYGGDVLITTNEETDGTSTDDACLVDDGPT